MANTDAKETLVKLAEGVYVEKDTLNIAEKIQEYDPRLRLKFCDPDRSEINDAPYLLVEQCPDGAERVVFYIWKLDDRVLERLYAADRYKHDIMGNIDTNNRLLQEKEQQRYRENILEAHDMVEAYLKSPKGRYSMTDPLTGTKFKLDDQPGVRPKVERAD